MPCRIVEGNLWDADAEIIGVTTNAFVTGRGALVMGKGAAEQAAKRYLTLPFIAGAMIEDLGAAIHVPQQQPRNLYRWQVCYVSTPTSGIARVGLFQVKLYFRAKAEPRLIAHSASALRRWVEEYDKTVAINFPGIGWGGLDRAEVEPILHAFLYDPRITVYYQEPKSGSARCVAPTRR